MNTLPCAKCSAIKRGLVEGFGLENTLDMECTCGLCDGDIVRVKLTSQELAECVRRDRFYAHIYAAWTHLTPEQAMALKALAEKKP